MHMATSNEDAQKLVSESSVPLFRWLKSWKAGWWEAEFGLYIDEDSVKHLLQPWTIYLPEA